MVFALNSSWLRPDRGFAANRVEITTKTTKVRRQGCTRGSRRVRTRRVEQPPDGRRLRKLRLSSPKLRKIILSLRRTSILQDSVRTPQIRGRGRRRVSQKRQSAKRLRNGHRKVANPPRVERSEGLEGSRFIVWQLYGSLAGGSRECLEVWQFYGPVVSAAGIDAMGKTLHWVMPGSRLLPTHRAATL
jgi:hypothetical protein